MTESTSQGKEDEDSTPLEQSNEDKGDSEEYWTPERMRDAKPVELPAPDTPPVEAPEPPSAPPAGGAPGEPVESEGLEVATPQLLIEVREDSKALEAAQSIGGVSASKLGAAGWYGVVLAKGVSVEGALERARDHPLIVTAEPATP